MSLIVSFWDSFLYILPFLFLITVLVFFHELGHYWFARKYGVGVEVFSIGFGPELFGWTDRHQTRWRFALIPLGGYVKMVGDANAASQPSSADLKKMPTDTYARSLHAQSPWRRIVVSFAGPAANFVLTLVVFAVVFAVSGEKITAPILGRIVEESPAEKAGLMVGDRVVSVYVPLKEGESETAALSAQVLDPQGAVFPGKKRIETRYFSDVQRVVVGQAQTELIFEIERAGQMHLLKVIPSVNQEIPYARLGFVGIGQALEPHSVMSSLPAAVRYTYDLSCRTLEKLWHMLIGREDSTQLGGMFMIAKSAHDSAYMGWIFFLEFMAILSLNLGLINLFPIPMLDGGNIVFYTIEWVIGRPLSEKVQDILFKLGFGILISLMVYSHWNDVQRLGLIRWVVDWGQSLMGK